ncbi:hypothetical protein EV44_g3646 [Erysiphe necator]|uniref:Reverse transcriptase Ty1/copia-type domain-containing protein n=1 Tax=Uncinula necator TaxID=52586 RepID=A0A0B1P5K3_UNCNE|nr:hypothetical protein EV44_g3646 [Erysiphe necator]
MPIDTNLYPILRGGNRFGKNPLIQSKLSIEFQIFPSGSAFTLYIQCGFRLTPVDFYIRPPIELGNKETILKVVKPLYGVPEAGNHWFYTYHRHHTQNLALKQSTFDPCLLYSTNETKKGYGILGLQTDDTLILADDDFAAEEEIQLEKAKFIAKKRKLLTETESLNFNGGDINKEKDSLSICLTQEMHCRNLRLVESEPTDIVGTRSKTRKAVSQLDQFVSHRARGAYIASVCQPEASFDLSSAAHVTVLKQIDFLKVLRAKLQKKILK